MIKCNSSDVSFFSSFYCPAPGCVIWWFRLRSGPSGRRLSDSWDARAMVWDQMGLYGGWYRRLASQRRWRLVASFSVLVLNVRLPNASFHFFSWWLSPGSRTQGSTKCVRGRETLATPSESWPETETATESESESKTETTFEQEEHDIWMSCFMFYSNVQGNSTRAKDA